MQDGRILNHQLTASSDGMWINFQSFKAKDARLKLQSLSWVSGILDSSPWLQVSFAPEIKIISGIATQGNPSHDWWTTSFTLKYSMTGKIWQDCEKEGFEEVSEVATDKIAAIARVIKIQFRLKLLIHSIQTSAENYESHQIVSNAHRI